MRKELFLLLVPIIFTSVIGFSQDFSNKGKDFWVGYGNHVRMFNNQVAETMQIYLTSDVSTTGNISILSIGFTQNFTVIQNQVTVVNIPRSAALLDEGLYNHGIHITALKPIVAYGFIYVSAVSGATVFLPTNTLGKNYYSLNYSQVSNEANSYSYFFAEAVDTGTTVIEITPSQNTKGGWLANVTKTINLTQGQIYQVLSPTDLTGSTIKSVASGNSGCKKIAVFCGSGKISIGCAAAGSSDNLYQQMYPASTWGKKYILIPGLNRPNVNTQPVINTNFFRIFRPDPTTVVNLNGVPIPSGSFTNNYYQFSSKLTNLVDADKPILVAQYFTTAGCSANNNPHDPEMIYLNSVEQTITDVTVNSMQPASNTAITQHFINVVLRNAGTGISSFKIDGVTPNATATVLSQDINYAYIQIYTAGNTSNPLASGAHHLTCDSGFNAIAYGFGSAESYGYSAGTSLRDLYTFITPINPLNISNQTIACTGNPFYFSVTYPYKPLSLYWDFYNKPTGNPYPNITISNPSTINDSTYFINGKQVWRYKLPVPYNFTTAGVYPVSITSETSGSDGCGSFQVRDDSLYVYEPAPVVIANQSTGCFVDSVAFFDSTVYPVGSGIYHYQWQWNFGDPGSGAANTSTLKNPKHKFSSPGTFNVTLTALGNIGCYTLQTTKQVIVTEVPSALFSLSNPVCDGKPITLIDSSTSNGSSILAKWYWDYGDGIKDTVLTNSSRIRTYFPWGNKTASLKVENNNGCQSTVFNQPFVVHPIPVANFILPAGICLPADSARFFDAGTIADGSQAGFGYLWTFGDPVAGANNTATLKNPAHYYTGTGPFTINLQTTSAAGCVHDTSKILSTVYLQAIAGFSVNVENCLNSITSFTSSSNGNGNSITNWYWDYGDGSPIVTTQNSTHVYATAGTKTIRHWVSTDKGCTSDTMTKTVIIHPLPTAGFTASGPFCVTTNINFTSTSVANAGNLTGWKWDLGDGSLLDLTNGNPFTHPYSATGTYPVTLTVSTDKGCVSSQFIQPVTIDPLPRAGFIIPEVCLSDTYAQFNDTSSIVSGTITSWLWNFGDPVSGALNTATQQNPQHSYTLVGPYSVLLTVTSNSGCVNSISQGFTVNGSNPVANFTVNKAAALCANDSVSITNTSTVFPGSITKLEIYWDNAGAPALFETDDFPATGKLYKHRYANFQSPLTKNFTVRLKAYSGGVCVNDRLQVITVNAAPDVQFNPLSNTCLDAAIYQISQASEIGGVPGTFQFTGPGVSPSGIFNPAAAGAGTHTILYTFGSTAGGCIDTASRQITVLAPPLADFNFTLPACETKTIGFTSSSSSPVGTITDFTWDFADGSPVVVKNTPATFTHSFAGAANYDVTLRVTTSNGCMSTLKQLPVAVKPLPKPNFAIPVSVCLPAAPVSFNNLSTIADGTENAFTYLWNFDDPLSGANNGSVAKTPTHIYSGTGPFNVSLQVTSGSGCIEDTTIVLNTIHPQPSAAFSSDKPSVCIGDVVVFSDLSDGGDGLVTAWNWDFGDDRKDITRNPAHLYGGANTFNVSLFITNSNGCNSDTVSQPFTVHPYPVVNAGPDRVVLEGGVITLQTVVTGNDLQYLWDPVLYLNSNTIPAPSVTNPLADITYTLEVTARGGCMAADKVIVTLLKAPKVPNTFTPNGDGINERWLIRHLESYPDCRVQVFTRNGQLVYESKGYSDATAWNGTINGKTLPIDTYYYIIEPGSGRKAITGYVTIVK
ncbi:MAG: PKD domain-containing protein [Ferruginibacter sp.]|nr:PKD domain-containing protein [Ferruginibacter sp.]